VAVKQPMPGKYCYANFQLKMEQAV